MKLPLHKLRKGDRFWLGNQILYFWGVDGMYAQVSRSKPPTEDGLGFILCTTEVEIIKKD